MGLTLDFSAPENRIFYSTGIYFKKREGGDGTFTGTLSEGGRRLQFDAKIIRDLIGGGDDYLDFTVTLKAAGGSQGSISGSCKTSSGGCLRGGGGIAPMGKQVPLAYTATVHDLGSMTASLGPGKFQPSFTVPMPKTNIDGVLTLTAPKYAQIGSISVTSNGSTSFHHNEWTSAAVLPRMTFGPDVTVAVNLLAEGEARPSTTGIGSVTITDSDNILASGEIRMSYTLEGCITWEYYWVPLPAIITSTFWSKVRNSCMADIDVRVLYHTGETAWKTISPHHSEEYDWWVPFDEPYGIKIGTIRPK